MRTFYLDRKKDVSGVSGVGRVAEGIVFHNGVVALSWYGKYRSVEILLDGIDEVLAIHGHDGATSITWANDIKWASISKE